MSTSPMHSKMPLEDDEFSEMAREATRAHIKRETHGFGFHSCALQIKDQARSKWFYTQVLGMDIVKETESHDVTMIFLAFPNPVDRETPDLEFGQRRGLLQLIQVAGDDSDDSFQVHHGYPGFSHLSVSVSDLEGSLARMKSMGVTIVQPGTPEQGYAIVSDPNGYSIQLLSCQIDQSRALKRQLELIMTSSSGGSAPRRSLSAAEDAGSGKSEQLITITSTPPLQLPSLSQFRGGSPDYEHPHWSTEAPVDGSPSASASQTATHSTGPPTVTATKMRSSFGSRPANAVPLLSREFENLTASPSASASSTAFSNGGSNERHSSRSVVSHFQSRSQRDSVPPSSIERSNAPGCIDLPASKERPWHPLRRKTVSPSHLTEMFSSYPKFVNSGEEGCDGCIPTATHRSLPSSPRDTGVKTTGGEVAEHHLFHPKLSSNHAPSKRPAISSLKSFRNKISLISGKKR